MTKADKDERGCGRRESLLEAVWHHVVGYRYYAIVSNSVGTMQIHLHTRICRTRGEAEAVIAGCTSYNKVEIIAFWSRNRYMSYVDENGVTQNRII